MLTVSDFTGRGVGCAILIPFSLHVKFEVRLVHVVCDGLGYRTGSARVEGQRQSLVIRRERDRVSLQSWLFCAAPVSC